MRALGPGSVSSFLKVVVEVIYLGLVAAASALLIAGLTSLLLQPFTSALPRAELEALQSMGLDPQRPLALALLALAVFVAGQVVVFNRLRRVFGTLTLGDPFHPDNVARLRVIGLALIGLELMGYLLRMTLAFVFPGRVTGGGLTLNLTAWFAILVVFVLAEVFREGARLRRDAELTI
ncbi:DUF2975 domain-containing protein [Caulobacter sp. S45]|uniref:DUF2975 domain-containing protein n=1 Tax=Caulobacter sp. S45 TaxID=1641861 RepID=UPI0015758F35|nr:DUF2975 domain-containing protein [Caulobacter sp. S45]